MLHSLACRMICSPRFNALPAPIRSWAIDRSALRFAPQPGIGPIANALVGSRFHFLLWLSPSWRRGWND